jgi:hypothetical protein
VSLRIACDLDGTVADMDAALQREAESLFGPEAIVSAGPAHRLESAEDIGARAEARAPTGSPGALTSKQVRRLWDHVASIDNFWISLGEIEAGAVARLAAAARAHRWEVLFLTQRPPSAGETTQIQSQRWLQAHGFELPCVMVMAGSRGKVAHSLALDVVVDDRPENCLDVLSDSAAKPVLVWRAGPRRIPGAIAGLPVELVTSLAGAIEYLEQATAERNRGQTLFGRLKKAFGATP